MLNSKTLRVLREYSVPREKINIFVADEEELEEYRRVCDSESYGSIHVGVPGMGAIRNFITDYYPEGTKLLCIDDDINGFMSVDGVLEDLNWTVSNAFERLERTNLRLFGFYPVCNRGWMRGWDSFDLR